MLTPPLKRIGLDHLDAQAVADQPRLDLDRRQMFGSRNMSTVSRAGTKSSAPWRCSIAKASRPMMTRPCSEFGSHGPLAASSGDEGVAVAGEKRLICHGAGP